MHPDHLDSNDPRDELPGAPPHDPEFDEGVIPKGQPGWVLWGAWYSVDADKSP